MTAVLTAQTDDFPRWYQEVLAKAELADNGPVRGTMVIRPYGYAIWERVQAEVDARIKAAGADNVYFPLLIPYGHLRREAEHVDGFSPELAVVTEAGGKPLEEPAVIRPTSETVFGDYMAKWIQSYRDLPLRLNQWANVVRWELRPRMFLRTTEFLWQEGHTAHASWDEAVAYARRIHADVYRRAVEDELAIPALVGIKTEAERFAGAVNTLTCEAMMRDRKALQVATTHDLGQNFSRAFDITYTDDRGVEQLCWTTSWGSSTRLVGALIMAHGDDRGLRLPPHVAPIQVVVVAVKDDPAVLDAVREVERGLTASGVRVHVDDRTDLGLGRRLTDWELKGIPVRVELGPRDVAAGTAVLVRRERPAREEIPLGGAVRAVADTLEEIQRDQLGEARAMLAACTRDVGGVDEAIDAAQEGFARLDWSLCGVEGERRLNASGVTVRCIQTPDGGIPEGPDAPGLVAIAGRGY
jgi:prolyl-tRNA synthetase